MAGAAAGATARGGRASRLRTLARDLHAPVDTSSLAARVAGRRQNRTGVRKRTLKERALVKLERLAAVGPTPAVRIRAAGFAACVLLALRHASAKKCWLHSAPSEARVRASVADITLPSDFRDYLIVSGGVLRGVVLVDPKTNMEDGIPCVTSMRGASGSSA